MKKLFSSLLSIFLPHYCQLCRLTQTESGLCTDCENELAWQSSCCPQCAIPMATALLCGQCLTKPPAFDCVIAPFHYEGNIATLITRLKFHEKLSLAPLLSSLLQKKLASCDFIKPDVLMPVPLHASRFKERGFNQTLEIAKPLAKALAIDLDRYSLLKTKATPPQTQQNLAARQQNIRNAFTIKKSIAGLHIGLVEDVVTTGSTIQEIAQLLKYQGASRVSVLAIARTKLH